MSQYSGDTQESDPRSPSAPHRLNSGTELLPDRESCFIQVGNEIMSKYAVDSLGLHRLVLDYFIPLRIRTFEENFARRMQNACSDGESHACNLLNLTARFIVILLSKVFCPETLAFAMIVLRAINHSDKIKWLFFYYLITTVFVLSMKRFFWRNRPYRKGLKNLLLVDEWSSFPSTNIFLSVTMPFSIMRQFNSNFYSNISEHSRHSKIHSYLDRTSGPGQNPRRFLPSDRRLGKHRVCKYCDHRRPCCLILRSSIL